MLLTSGRATPRCVAATAAASHRGLGIVGGDETEKGQRSRRRARPAISLYFFLRIQARSFVTRECGMRRPYAGDQCSFLGDGPSL